MIFRRELSPASLLALTDTHLLLIAEEKEWKIRAKYGYSVTYCPLSRIEDIRIIEDGLVHVMNVERNCRSVFHAKKRPQ
jgi:hypothetical protein